MKEGEKGRLIEGKKEGRYGEKREDAGLNLPSDGKITSWKDSSSRNLLNISSA